LSVRSIGRKKQVRLGGGTGRRTGLKIRGILRFNNIRVLPKSTENIIQTLDWSGFLADLRGEAGVKLPKIHRRQIGDSTCLPSLHLSLSEKLRKNIQGVTKK
jgi:hypothetical protein